MLKDHFKNIITDIGEDVSRPGLVDTPKRASEAFQFLTQGYQQSLDSIVNGALFDSDCDDMIMVNNIELYSLCEHHLLPFMGECHVAYLPNGKVLGFSKVARIVDHFAKRLQIQEHLTHQIAAAIMEVTNAHGVGVVIEAQHLCMIMRGVEKHNAIATTSSMLGLFRDDLGARNEFLTLIRSK